MTSRVPGERPPQGEAGARPPVSVIVPFAGSPGELGQLVENLNALERRPGDELIVVDNRPGKAPRPGELGAVRLHRANQVLTPAFARNHGAGLATGEWLAFLDADTRPQAGLLDAYFDPPPGADTGIMAGGILDVAPRPSLVARRDVARRRWSQEMTTRRPGTPYAQTGNCAVLRAAFERAGGFESEARAGEDADLSFRIQREGWRLEERPEAVVEHAAAETLSAWVAQQIRHGSGAAWANRRWPGEFPAPGPRWLIVRTLRLLRQAIACLRRGDREEAAFSLLDLLGACALDLGRLIPNRPRSRAGSRRA